MPTFEDALREDNPDRRADALAAIIVELRSQNALLSLSDAERLYDKVFELAEDPNEFDGRSYRFVWQLLRRAPPFAALRQLAERMLINPRMLCRSDGLAFLLRAYPEQQASLIERYGKDADPYVQDAIATALAQADAERAVEHWERVFDARPVPHDLAETVPHALAAFARKGDLARYEELDRAAGRGSLWGITAGLMRSRRL